MPPAEKCSNARGVAENDRVVRTIDVFFTPRESDVKLYLLQYPLRPPWRPYNDGQYSEVRVKPNQGRVEVDCTLDQTNENYDQEASEHLRIKKCTLTSSHTPLVSSYAVGVLRGNQLRPSLQYLGNDAKGKASNRGLVEDLEDMEEGEDDAEAPSTDLTPLQVQIRRRETERQVESRMQSHAYLKQQDEAEPWLTLPIHDRGSDEARDIHESLFATTNYPIPFNMTRSQYLSKLCPPPGLAVDTGERGGLSKSYLDALPLEERIHAVLVEGEIHIRHYLRIFRVARGEYSDREILAILEKKAQLIEGCWVTKSELFLDEKAAALRDYLLSRFALNRMLHLSMKEEHLPQAKVKAALQEVAILRKGGQWEFKIERDEDFIKKFPDVVERQQQQWADAEPSIRERMATHFPYKPHPHHHGPHASTAAATAATAGPSSASGAAPAAASSSAAAPASSSGAPGAGAAAKQGPPAAKPAAGAESEAKEGAAAKEGVDVASKAAAKGKGVAIAAAVGGASASKSTVVAAPVGPSPVVPRAPGAPLTEDETVVVVAALRKVFEKQSVCSVNAVRGHLRKFAAEGSKEHADILAAAATLAGDKLEALLAQVASEINHVYFPTTVGDPAVDPFRKVVLALLKIKPTGVRKSDIMEASKIALKMEISAAIYNKVVKDLCVAKNGAWLLKSGDGDADKAANP
eukprot:jgi/Mesvir1/5899/Mv00670-RA.1